MKKLLQTLFISFLCISSLSSLNAQEFTPEQQAKAHKEILKMHHVVRSLYKPEIIPQSFNYNLSIGEVINNDINLLTKIYKKGACRQFSSYYIKYLTQNMKLKATYLFSIRVPKNSQLVVNNYQQLDNLISKKEVSPHVAVIYELNPGQCFVLDIGIENCVLPITDYFETLKANFDLITLYYYDDNLYNNPKKLSELPLTVLFSKIDKPNFEFTPFTF